MNDEDSEFTNDFEKAVGKPRISFFREVLIFLGQNKKWWLLPIIIVFVIFGVLLIFSAGADPFIYSLF